MNRLLALVTVCCFITGFSFADEPVKKVYKSVIYHFGIEKHKKDYGLQIVKNGTDYEMLVYAPKGRAFQKISTNDSYGNLYSMYCVDCKSVETGGIEYDLLTFSVPGAFGEEDYLWKVLEVDGQIVPNSIAKKMRKKMQKGLHVVNMRYNYDRARLPSKIKIEDGWYSSESRFSFVPGRDFYSW